MREKNLTEAEWRRFSQGRGYKDAALLKALAALGRAEQAAPAQQIEALDEVGKQVVFLRKANKADKELDKHLDALDQSARSQRKLFEQAAEAEDHEEESPALLNSKMIPLLREVRKGTVLKALIALAGPDAAVLVSRRTIGTSLRKLLAAEIGATGNVKYVPGECLFEANAHTFVVQSQAAGMAKKLKSALLRQTGQRFNIRVRGESPDDVDEDAEDTTHGDDKQPDTPPPEAPAGNSTPRETPNTDPGAALKARLAALLPAIQQAMSASRPEGAAARLKASEAGVFARKKQFDDAHRMLDLVEAMLKSGRDAGEPAIPRPGNPDVPGGIRGAAVDYAKCRLAWTSARDKVRNDLRTLERIILDEFSDAAELGELSRKIRKFDTVLEEFSDDLGGLLDEALNASDDATRNLHHRHASQIVAKFLDRAASDPLIENLQRNPFAELNVKQTLVSTLDVLARRLS